MQQQQKKKKKFTCIKAYFHYTKDTTKFQIQSPNLSTHKHTYGLYEMHSEDYYKILVEHYGQNCWTILLDNISSASIKQFMDLGGVVYVYIQISYC